MIFLLMRLIGRRAPRAIALPEIVSDAILRRHQQMKRMFADG